MNITADTVQVVQSLVFIFLVFVNFYMTFSYMRTMREARRALDLNLEALKLLDEVARIAVAASGMKIMSATGGNDIELEDDSGNRVSMRVRKAEKPGKLH